MINIQEIKQLVQSQDYQQLAQRLIQKYQLNVQEEDSIQGWNIDCQLLNPSGFSLSQLYQHLVENAELIGIMLAQREQKNKGNGYFMPSIFLHTSMDLLLLQDKNRLMDYLKKVKMPAPTKVAKEWQQELTVALAILNGEEPPKMPESSPKKSTKKTQKITLGTLSVSEYFEDEKMTTATLWGKETRIFLTGDCQDIPLQKVENWLTWVEENQDEIIHFALEIEDFVGNFNVWVSDEVQQKGKAKLPDGTELTEPAGEQDIKASIFIDSICVDLEEDTIDNLSIDLMTKPDYFGGHALNIEVDKRKKLSFGSMNG